MLEQSYEGSSNCRIVTYLACIINADYELVAALRFRVRAAVSLVVFVLGWGIRGWHLVTRDSWSCNSCDQRDNSLSRIMRFTVIMRDKIDCWSSGILGAAIPPLG